MIFYSLMIGSVSGENWIKTNLVNFASTNSAKVFIESPHENVIWDIYASAIIGGKIVADYVGYPIPDSLTNGMTTNISAQASGDFNNGLLQIGELDDKNGDRPVNSSGMNAKAVFFASLTNQTRLAAGYFRGRIYENRDSLLLNKSIGMSDLDWATVFSSGDRKRLVVARDNGSIYFSDDSGFMWQTIDTPGKYTFTLSSTPKGSTIVAVITIGINSSKDSIKEWYLVGDSAVGNKLVVSSQSAPVLDIIKTNDKMTISWASSFTNFVLQQNSDLLSTNWLDMTNVVDVVKGQNEVTLPSVQGNNFFRLRSK